MRYHVLACDYDGTLAHNGNVEQEHIEALEQLVTTGRKLVLVTGRELPELLQVFPRIDIFEIVVAENGALLYRPKTRAVKNLADPPSASLIAALKKRAVPLSIGKCLIAT